MIDSKFLIILWIFVSCFGCGIGDAWIEPDAWGRQIDNNFKLLAPKCDCTNVDSPQPNSVDNVSFIYYKKLLRFLFNRDKLEFEEDKNLYNRAILFTLTSSQLQKLENSIDPRDLDAVLNEIIPKVKNFNANNSQAVKISWWTKFYNFIKTIFMKMFSLSEFRFELLLFIAVLTIIYIRKLYGTSLIFIIVCGVFLSGFIYKYYECNRKLEIDQLAELYDLENNPCGDNFKDVQPSIWNLWGLLISKPSRAQCMDYLRKKNKIKLPFCRPDDVALTYLNDIILEQFRMTVEKCTNIFKDINELIPFPYNIVATIIFSLTLLTFLKLFFKYILSPQVWSNFYWNTHTRSSGNGDPGSSKHPQIHNHYYHHGGSSSSPPLMVPLIEDKISGENLKQFLEICNNKFEKSPHKVESISIVASGVQILAAESSSSVNCEFQNNNENDVKTIAEISKRVPSNDFSSDINSKEQNESVNNNVDDVNGIEIKEMKGKDIEIFLKLPVTETQNNDRVEIEEKDIDEISPKLPAVAEIHNNDVKNTNDTTSSTSS